MNAPLRHLQGPLLRAEGDAPVRLPAATGSKVESVLEALSPRDAASARPAGSAEVNRGTVGRPSHIWPGEHARDLRDEPVALSPRTRVRSSSMRSGPSWPRKEKNCDSADPADDSKGDTWDHVAIRSREPARSSASCPASGRPENVAAVVEDFRRRTGGRLMDFITTDGYPAYERCDTPGRLMARRSFRRGPAREVVPGLPYQAAPPGLDLRGGGEDSRKKGRVVKRSPRGWSSARWPPCGWPWGCRRRAVRSTRRPWGARTRRTVTAAHGRPARRSGSAKIVGIMKRSPT